MIRNKRLEKTTAWAIHTFTSIGIVLGFLSLLSVLSDDRVGAFLWLAAALFVDGVDGTLARKARVSEVTPNINGAVLDNIVDYFTYVIIPAMMIYQFALVPEGWELAASSAVLLASCYTFANTNLKTYDYFFCGFPALWNIVVLYFHILETSTFFNALCIAVFCVLTFIPIKYVHPLRVEHWRKVTIPVTAAWCLCCLGLLLGDEINTPIVYPLSFWGWVLANVYFLYLSFDRSRVNKKNGATL